MIHTSGPGLSVELVYFTGCPHVGQARLSLREALQSVGLPGEWKEWNQFDPATPDHVLGYASPTILIGGRDIGGGAVSKGAMACRVDGLASPETIRAALARELGDPAP